MVAEQRRQVAVSRRRAILRARRRTDSRWTTHGIEMHLESHYVKMCKLSLMKLGLLLYVFWEVLDKRQDTCGVCICDSVCKT